MRILRRAGRDAANQATPSMRKRWLIYFLVFNATLATLATASVWHYGSMKRAIDVWNGRVILPNQETKALELGTLDKSGEVTFEIKNHGRDTVKVVGCFIGCVGKMLDGPPFALDPGQARQARFLIRCAPGDPLDNSIIRIELYTNLQAQRTVPLRVQLRRAEAGK